MPAPEESAIAVAFRRWLEKNDAYVHPSLYFATGQYGSSVFTSGVLESESTIVSCPISLIITPKYARDALELLASTSCPLDDREVICTYLVLHAVAPHRLSASKDCESVLKHQPYIDSLPNELWTPLFWTEEELRMLDGTNLRGATQDRKDTWLGSWNRSSEWVQSVQSEWRQDFTWERFLRAQTWLSSRAFPSSLLDDPPSLSKPRASPVLIPLVDSLNHARGTPVSWSIDRPTATKERSLSLVSHKLNNAGEELYNNYGPKPNDELLLGYGFVLSDNPDDALLLKLPASERRYRIGRKATGEVEAVWNEIGRRLQEGFPMDADNLDVMLVELEMEIGQILPEMVANLRERLPDTSMLDQSRSLPGVRTQVQEMILIYVQGQREILDDLLGFAERRLKAAIDRAQELGVDITLESDGEDE